MCFLRCFLGRVIWLILASFGWVGVCFWVYLVCFGYFGVSGCGIGDWWQWFFDVLSVFVV